MFESIQAISIWITWTIIHFIWIGVVIWSVAQFFRFALAKNRPAIDYRINLVAIAALILAFPLAASFELRAVQSYPLSKRTSNIMADFGSPAEFPDSTIDSLDSSGLDTPPKSTEPGSQGFPSADPNDTTRNPSPPIESVVQTANLTWAVPLKSQVARLSPWIACIYFTGVVFMLARLLMMFVGCRKIQRDSAILVGTKTAARISTLARRIGLRATPAIRLSARVASPIIVGILKPMLLVPGCVLTGMTADELDSILIHELAHLKRYDHFVLMIQRIAEAVFFFHPVIWHLSFQLSRTRELCCDDIVLAQGTSPLDYARGLCNVAELSIGKTKPSITNAASGESPVELIARVRRVLGESANVRISPSLTTILATAILVLSPFPIILALSTTNNAESNSGATSTEILNIDHADNRANKSQQDSTAELDSSSERTHRYTVSGTVIDIDGQPVPNAVIRCRDDLEAETISTTDADGKFHVDMNCKNWGSLWVHSPDKKQIGVLPIGVNEIASISLKENEILLVTAVKHRVKVTKNGEPVQRAMVTGTLKENSQTWVSEMTNGEGIVQILLPKNATLDPMWAWHKTLGTGFCTDTTTSEIDIELLPTRTEKVLVRDEIGQPVANEPVNFSVRNQSRAIHMNPIHETTVNTNLDGIAECTWIPADRDYVAAPFFFQSTNYDWDVNRFSMTPVPDPGKPLVLHVNSVPERVEFRGQLTGIEGELGNIRIAFGGSGFMRDAFQLTTDEHGEFRTKIVPGINYAIGIVDDHWASDLKTVSVESDQPESVDITLECYPATPITVTITSGNDHQPVANASLRYHVSKKIKTGPQAHGLVWLDYKRVADENGQVIIHAAKGGIYLIADAQRWNERKKLFVELGKPMQVDFHAPELGTRIITGSIIGPTTADLDQCEIQLFDRGSEIEPTKSDANGNWNAEIDYHLIKIRVLTADKRFGALAFDENVGTKVSLIELRPTVTVAGTLVDDKGTPLPGIELVQHYSDEREPRHQLRYLTTTTDQKGHFKFEGVMTGIPQRLSVKVFNRGIQFVGNRKTYRPGENVDHVNVVYVDRLKKLRDSNYSRSSKDEIDYPYVLKGKTDEINELAQASHMHGLFILVSQKGSESARQAIGAFFDYSDDNFDILNFLAQTRFIENENSTESQRLLPDWGIKAPAVGQVACIIMDGDGKKLEARTFETSSPELKNDFRDLLRRNLPPKRDARKLLDDAIQKARDEGKYVFVKMGGPRCAPCLKMSVWLEREKTILDKDYVTLSFHPSRCENGIEISKRLCESPDGTPWFTILDADGMELINSEGPLGNVGFPVGGGQATDHFIKMIESTRNRISDDELEKLRSSLTNFE